MGLMKVKLLVVLAVLSVLVALLGKHYHSDCLLCGGFLAMLIFGGMAEYLRRNQRNDEWY